MEYKETSKDYNGAFAVTEVVKDSGLVINFTDTARLPSIDSHVYKTRSGTPYFREPGVVMLSRPQVDISGMAHFLEAYELDYDGYTKDFSAYLSPGAKICKTAGQACYNSYGVRRSYDKDAAKYFANILESKHGSVLEHANYTFLFYGISRSVTHELVRHRIAGYSQQSQRYVNGKVLRFVERPEDAEDEELHRLFLDRIDTVAEDYEVKCQYLLQRQRGAEAGTLTGDSLTEARKKVQQSARSLLPNETEAPIIVTMNVRSWRHFIEQRASLHAEIEINRLAFRAFVCLLSKEPLLFGDYQYGQAEDGRWAVRTDNVKV